MTKTYLVSETILRQVLDALEYHIPNSEHKDWEQTIALRTLLAKEPSEPVGEVRPNPIQGYSDLVTMFKEVTIKTSLYRKDA